MAAVVLTVVVEDLQRTVDEMELSRLVCTERSKQRLQICYDREPEQVCHQARLGRLWQHSKAYILFRREHRNDICYRRLSRCEIPEIALGRFAGTMPASGKAKHGRS